jgi:hypothetical protein
VPIHEHLASCHMLSLGFISSLPNFFGTKSFIIAVVLVAAKITLKINRSVLWMHVQWKLVSEGPDKTSPGYLR